MRPGPGYFLRCSDGGLAGSISRTWEAPTACGWRAGSTGASAVHQAFEQAGVDFPPDGIFLRVFKREGRLELWARKGGVPFRLIRSYAITQSSGKPGPKRREGDLQVPEGFYEIDRFNPESSYHLSLGLNYPNASDRLRSDPAAARCLDIFVHGVRVRSVAFLAWR